MAKKATKKQTVAASKTDPVLHFARERWWGVAALAAITVAGAWATWHIQTCLTDQKSQLAKARTAWTNLLIADQKAVSDAEAHLARSDLLRYDVINGAPQDALNLHRKALFDLAQVFTTDCLALKSSTYDFLRELQSLSREFSFNYKVISDVDISLVCEGMASSVELLRNPTQPGEEFPAGRWLTTYEAVYNDYQNKIASRKASQRQLTIQFEELFKSLENEGFLRRATHCLW